MIEELHASQIDKRKWDAAVNRDAGSKVYAMSWYLDAVTGNDWRGFIIGDYESVLPFVRNRKLGIGYCYMPYFVQQFSVKDADTYLPQFIAQLRKHYKYGQLSFAQQVDRLDGANWEQRNNFELSLNDNYTVLKDSFSSNHKTNIHRFNKGNCTIAKSEQISDLIALLQGEKELVFQAKEMKGIAENIGQIYNAAARIGAARLYYATDEEGIAGGAFFVEDNNRLYYLLGIAKRKLKHSQSVSYGLLDHVIREHAGRSIVLDFEGSQIASISYFFKGFGAVNNPYWMLKWNDLPFFIKWIKK